VQDTGPGLSAEQCARLFQAFEQLDGSTVRRFGGTGLGLALTRRLVELMGGSIGVDSQPGRGSTFWFEVPLQRGHGPMPDDARVARQPIGADARLRQHHRGARVLLAEDNEINIEVVQEMLHAVGLDVVVAENGRVAVDQATRGEFDLMLMDMQMPEMDGLDATRRIRAMSLHASTPILALTANAFTDDRQACLDAGMNAMLTKPVDPALLYESLLQWLSHGAGQHRRTIAQPAAAALQSKPQAPSAPPSASALTPASTSAAVASVATDSVVGWLSLQHGIDLDGALSRVRGNPDRLVALLRQLTSLHVGDADLTRADLATGQRDSARQRMHKLKGAAAQLGLTALSDDATLIEVLLRADPAAPDDADVIDAALARLDGGLRAAVQALDDAGAA
jgi:CheY-like chemotaxis protein/HPt (histidine-containing phosphotransfer) domain-containing protein